MSDRRLQGVADAACSGKITLPAVGVYVLLAGLYKTLGDKYQALNTAKWLRAGMLLATLPPSEIEGGAPCLGLHRDTLRWAVAARLLASRQVARLLLDELIPAGLSPFPPSDGEEWLEDGPGQS